MHQTNIISSYITQCNNDFLLRKKKKGFVDWMEGMLQIMRWEGQYYN